MYIHTTDLFVDENSSEKIYALNKFFFNNDQLFNKNIKFLFENDVTTNYPYYENEIYIHSLYICYINRITNAINRSGVYTYTERTFELMAGHWLKRYLSTSFQKFKLIEKTLCKYPEMKVYDFLRQDNIHINTGEDFLFYANTSQWNHKKYLSIIKYLNSKIEIEKIDRIPFVSVINKPKTKSIHAFFKIIIRITNKINKKLFLSKPYLNRLSLIYLCIIKLCIPLPEFKVNVKLYSLNKQLRKKINLPKISNSDEFIKYIDGVIIDEIPTCYIEGINDMVEYSKTFYPEKVDTIFTSNSFDTDEIFKAWVCLQISNGTKYVVGQHGAGYGTSKYMKTFWEPEISTCDKFISWGWTTNKISKIRPHFFFKLSSKKIVRNVDNTKIAPLIIFPSINNLIFHWDDTENHLSLVESLINLCSKLDSQTINRTIIRLHLDYSKYKFNDYKFLKYRITNNLRIDNGKSKLSELISLTNVTIFLYDSTGFMEHLSQNLCCILYLEDGLDSIETEAKSDYKFLIDTYVIHLNMESLYKFINSNLNLANWWNSDLVCLAKNNFLKKYSNCRIDNFKLANEFRNFEKVHQ